MSDIPRPSICRMVVVSRKSGAATIMLGDLDMQTPMMVSEVPATVVALVTEEALNILCMVGNRWIRAPHADLAPADFPDDLFVWRWPPRVP